MKQTNTRIEASKEIEQLTKEFLARGGEIKNLGADDYDREYTYQHPPLNNNVEDTRNARRKNAKKKDLEKMLKGNKL